MDQTNRRKQFMRYRDSKFLTKHGIRVKNINTVYRLKQSFWIAKYNKYNMEQRIKGKNEF